MSKQRKAVALISGGLDSMLAARVIQEQGIHVEGINFFTGFCVEGHTHAIRKQDQVKPKRNNALWVAEQLGMRLHIVDIVDEYKDVLLNPRHGYGKHLNPCLDCKVYMVGKAYDWMVEHGFDFIITGEVVGQRPMSQRSETMPVVADESGVGDLLLRPLCARLLPPSRPEREGWVDRDLLLDFSGRSRKPQMGLANRLGIEDYAQPAGGCCFLTDGNYAAKLADLWQARGERDYDLDDIMLLKVGRHLRPRPHFKLVIAREEGEVNFLLGYRRQFTHLYTSSHPGPLALLDGTADADDIDLAARIVARYSQGRDAGQVSVEVLPKGGEPHTLEVRPFGADDIPEAWYV
ncbi:MAG: tRNA (5-methylaminomethyl-2-thiouridylate)-methyltransferase [Gammaproteobacteria bacterium]|nr:MAG: tRNA (5-methylaminomethyl-2-thiouridylate)-methyltransferase [Gammaproteobacteria bacterium]